MPLVVVAHRNDGLGVAQLLTEPEWIDVLVVDVLGMSRERIGNSGELAAIRATLAALVAKWA